MSQLIGRKIGKYQLVERLGKGGMAEVWKARQPNMERFVAIKLMHRHLADEPHFVERFRREGMGVGKLLHTNIVRVIDFDLEGDEHYMVMDYIQGGTLKEHLEQRRILPLAAGLRIVAQLADALAYAHQQGMIHRDITPSNIMFMDATLSAAVLTDFGIARLLDHGMTMTRTGAMLGTPPYMSPEALRSEKMDPRADIYSLGVVLYEMLTGRTPYLAETPYQLILKHLHESPTRPRELNPEIPLVVEELLLKALAKEADERFQSANEFHKAIQETLVALNEPNSGVRLSFVGPNTPQEKKNWLPRWTSLSLSLSSWSLSFDRTRWRRLGVVLLIILLITIMAILFLFDGKPRLGRSSLTTLSLFMQPEIVQIIILEVST